MYSEQEVATAVLRSRAPRIVTVYRVRVANSYAACSCGWSARRRILKALACQDAWMHAARGDCDVNVPLVIPGRKSCPFWNSCLQSWSLLRSPVLSELLRSPPLGRGMKPDSTTARRDTKPSARTTTSVGITAFANAAFHSVGCGTTNNRGKHRGV